MATGTSYKSSCMSKLKGFSKWHRWETSLYTRLWQWHTLTTIWGFPGFIRCQSEKIWSGYKAIIMLNNLNWGQILSLVKSTYTIYSVSLFRFCIYFVMTEYKNKMVQNAYKLRMTTCNWMLCWIYDEIDMKFINRFTNVANEMWKCLDRVALT